MKELPGKGHLWLLHNKRTVGTDLSVPASAHPSFLGFLVFAPLSVGAVVMPGLANTSISLQAGLCTHIQ